MSKRFPQFILDASRAYDLMQRQQRTGVKFDVKGARRLYSQINERMNSIEAEVNPQLPGRPLNIGETKFWTPPKIQFKKDGTPSAAVEKWFDKLEVDETSRCYGHRETPFGPVAVPLPWQEGPVIHILPMEIANQAALKDWLLSVGWKPTLWNYQQNSTGPGRREFARDSRGGLVKASPKFHDKGRICEGLSRMKDRVPFIDLIVEWLSLRNRRSTIWNPDKGTGWLENDRLGADGRLSAASTGLTNTKRQKHTVVANVPRVTSSMGREMRGLFIASEGRLMVGADASGLEARIKGHYTHGFDGGEYARKLLDPTFDEHLLNAGLWNCSRDDAKSPGYALQYNAKAPKFSETLGVPLKLGEKYYEAYWNENWALRSAIEAAEQEFEKNFKQFLTTIDGSKIVTRAKHSVFNARCQGAGARIMDKAGIIADALLERAGVDAPRVIYYHDEFQHEAWPEEAERVGGILCDAIRLAGEFYRMNVPLAGEFKVGRNWAETH